MELTLGVFELATRLDCGSPDDAFSIGADMLRDIQQAANDVYSDIKDGCGDEDALISEHADGTVSCYTHDQWRVFTDLMLYHRESDLLEGRDLSEIAGVVLYEFAEESIRVLLDELRELNEDEDEDAE